MQIHEPNKFELGPHGHIRPIGYPNNSPKYYFEAIYATMKEIKPKYCLEIGTLGGTTAGIMHHYLKNHQPDGLVISCDIHMQAHPDFEKMCPNVKLIHVYPHNRQDYVINLGRNGILKAGWETAIDDSVNANVSIIKEYMKQYGIDAFDFAYIDGDHQKDSLCKDIKICEHLLKEPRYMLLDDVHPLQTEHPSSPYFNNVLKYDEKYEVYDFLDWSVACGVALMWHKEDNK